MIKRWLEYIRESYEKDGFVYLFNEETLHDYLLIFDDNYYSVDITYGGFFDNSFLTMRDILNPGIRISIKSTKEVTNVDLTGEFRKIMRRIMGVCEKNYPDGKYNVFYAIGKSDYTNTVYYDINRIVVNGGFLKNGRFSSELHEYMGINIVLPIPEICNTPVKILNYYKIRNGKDANGVDSYKIEGDKVFYIISNRELAYQIVHYQSSYKEYLTSEDIIDVEVSSEKLSNSDLLNYHLSNENLKLFLKLVLKKNMFADFKQAYIDYNDLENKLDNLTDDEVIDYMVKNQDCICDILDEQEPCDDILMEIKDMYYSLECSEYSDEYHQAVQKEFEKKVEKEFLPECSTFRDPEHGLYWSIPFTREWLIDLDDDKIEDETIDSVFTEYLSVSNPHIKLNPYFPDYVTVDDKYFNEEVKSIIENAL